MSVLTDEYSPNPIEWVDPIQAAGVIATYYPEYIFLHSGERVANEESVSWIAFEPLKRIDAENIEENQSLEYFKSSIRNDPGPWFGYLGYDIKNFLENLPEDEPSGIRTPAYRFTSYNSILYFNHDRFELIYYRRYPTDDKFDIANLLRKGAADRDYKLPEIMNFRSNMTREDYLDYVRTILAHIKAGDLYQANLTRKYFGKTDYPIDPINLHDALHRASPAPYSAVLKYEDFSVVSSSPELFLHMENDLVSTRPIKGSAPVSTNGETDDKIRTGLYNSEKDRAENLMITDLMRNDLGRFCNFGSVKTERLFEVSTYRTIHHMSSTITGHMREDASVIDAVLLCFPPGSMTGAPKIRAMTVCSRLERLKRGVYSGAIGVLGDNYAKLSVVIRTVILRENMFEFQVGGGIVADSLPENELEEIHAKAAGICNAMGIDMDYLRRI